MNIYCLGVVSISNRASSEGRYNSLRTIKLKRLKLVVPISLQRANKGSGCKPGVIYSCLRFSLSSAAEEVS